VCDASGTTQITSMGDCAFIVGGVAAAASLLFGRGPNATAQQQLLVQLAAGKQQPSSSSLPSPLPPLPRVRVVADVKDDPRVASAAATEAAARGVNVTKSPPPPQPLFHEAGVWLAGYHPRGSKAGAVVLFTSDRLGNTSGVDQFVHLSLVDPTGRIEPGPVFSSRREELPMANGGTLVPGTKGAVALMCYQGTRSRGGGLAALNVATGEIRPIITRAGAAGGNFSSPNDVVIVPVPRAGAPPGVKAFAEDGARFAIVLLTDPSYGFDQGFRTGQPEHNGDIWALTVKLPTTKRWWPEPVGPARAVADDFGRPNGLAVSPDRKTLYASDTAYFSGGGFVDLSTGVIDGTGAGAPLRAKPARARTIYAQDLTFVGDGNGAPTVTLSPRRLFAAADVPIPDGLRTDADGNLFSGEGDGVSVYEPVTGRFLLRIRTGTAGGARSAGVANFALVPASAALGNGTAAGGYVVMGQQTQVTAVRLPGLRVFNTEDWL
jgi:gluconolactonase